jgi:hypothetical protein
MIFLSHNSKDKVLVEPIAIRLRDVFGEDNVFYDSWSIQPGDGIIDKMNEGLAKCSLFYFFVSNNSLESYMVKLEWQNAVMKMSKGNAKLIPVRIDDCILPPILSQSLYIDLYINGFDVALRQIIDIANGINTFRPEYVNISNIEAIEHRISNGKIEVEIIAKYFMEPIPNFAFVTSNSQDEISFSCKDCVMFTKGFNEGAITLQNLNTRLNAIRLDFPKPLTPKFPLVAVFEAMTERDIAIMSVMHEDRKDDWKTIPFRIKQ